MPADPMDDVAFLLWLAARDSSHLSTEDRARLGVIAHDTQSLYLHIRDLTRDLHHAHQAIRLAALAS